MWPDYRGSFEKFFHLFSKENVEIVSLQNHESVVTDFARRAEIMSHEVADKWSNKRISQEAVKLMYLFNESGAIYFGSDKLVQSRRKLLEMIEGSFNGPGFELPRELTRSWLNREDIYWLARETGIDFTNELTKQVSPFSKDELHMHLQGLNQSTRAKLQELLLKNSVKFFDEDSISVMLEKLYENIRDEKISASGT